MIVGSTKLFEFAEFANWLSLRGGKSAGRSVMVGKQAWVDHGASGRSSLDLPKRDWLGDVWDPVLYIVAALLCAILAIDAFVLLHTL